MTKRLSNRFARHFGRSLKLALPGLLVAVASMVCAVSTEAATINGTINTSNTFSTGNNASDGLTYIGSPSPKNAVFPLAPVTIGEFDFTIPAADSLVGATISGDFGIPSSLTTAAVNLFLDGIAVGSCGLGATCNSISTTGETPWSYTFSAADLFNPLLSSGKAILTAQQMSKSQIVLDATSFSALTAPVPEPSSTLLLGLGLPVIAWLSRRKTTARPA